MEALAYKVEPTTNEAVLEDEVLIKLCQSRDSQAQQALYERYVNQMLHVCLRYLGDIMESEDAVTEGFVKVFSKIDSFEYRGKGSLNGWIKRIMINESLMILRKRKVKNVEIEQVLHIEAEAKSDARLEEKELLKLVHELPKGYRTVFNMYVIEGYSHKEIAEQLDISENTSKSQLCKARASLIKSLKKHEAHEERN